MQDILKEYGPAIITVVSIVALIGLISFLIGTVTEVNGQPFDPEATYAVITSNANFNGMDSSYIFKAAAEANQESTITTAVVRDVIWMYIASELNNQIGAEYAEPQGRLVLIMAE